MSPAATVAPDAAGLAEHAAAVAREALGVAQGVAAVAQEAAVLAGASHLEGPDDGVVEQPSVGPGRGSVLDGAVVAGLRELGPDFLARLVPVFVLSAPDRLAAIRAALEAGDPVALADAAHFLRGSAGNLGGHRVADLCAEIEQDPGAGAGARLGELEVELPRLLNALLALVRVTA